jgi:DNA-binding NtrC family response regulator
MYILLVDDDDVFRDALGELLRDDGHDVEAYGSIRALPPLHSLSPAALITDYQLGEFEDGLTLARRFHSVHPVAAIIIITAHASQHLLQAAAEMPYASVLRKPLPYDHLHRLLHASQAGH